MKNNEIIKNTTLASLHLVEFTDTHAKKMLNNTFRVKLREHLSILHLKFIMGFIKYISPLIIVFSFIFLFYGGFVIINEKGPSFQVLTSFASFLGGVLTVIAVTITTKEYFSFKIFKSDNEFRNFIVKSIRPLREDIKTDFADLRVYLLSFIDERESISEDELNKRIIKIRLLSSKYNNISTDIDTQFKDITYHNKSIKHKFAKDINLLQMHIAEFKLAIIYVLLHYYDEPCEQHKSTLIKELRADKFKQAATIAQLIKLVKEIDEKEIF